MYEIFAIVIRAVLLAGNASDATTSTTPVAPDIGTLIQQMASGFVTVMSQALSAADSVLIELAQVALVTALILGVLLYFTHVSKRLGKDLIIGGIVLWLMCEFAFPYISQL